MDDLEPVAKESGGRWGWEPDGYVCVLELIFQVVPRQIPRTARQLWSEWVWTTVVCLPQSHPVRAESSKKHVTWKNDSLEIDTGKKWAEFSVDMELEPKAFREKANIYV